MYFYLLKIFFTFCCLILNKNIVGSLNLRDLVYDDYEENSNYNFADKRGGQCPPWRPFMCPEGDCLHLSQVCDGNPECGSSGYDENSKLCTAKRRPPMEYTESFLQELLASFGDDYFVKFLGPKAANKLEGLGGTEKVAIAFSESKTVEDFAKELRLSSEQSAHLAKMLQAISQYNEAVLEATDIKPAEFLKLKIFVNKLVETGFLKPARY